MSHINDALQKAQQEKDTLYRRYEDLIKLSPPDEGTGRRRIPLSLAVVILAVIAGASVMLFTRQPLSISRQEMPPVRETAGETIEKATMPVKAEAKQKTIAAAPGESEAAQKKMTPVSGKVAMTTAPKQVETQQKKPPATGTLYQRALKLQNAGNLTGAEGVYRQILSSDGDHVCSLNNLGVILMGRQEKAEALACFRKAVNRKADYVDPYYNMACIFSQQGKLTEAMAHLTRACRLNGEARHWAMKDGDLAPLRERKDFKLLMKSP